MKKSTKAALLSAFVFPGMGHFYLRSPRRGMVFMLIILGAIVFAVWSTTSSLLENLDPSTIDKLQKGTASMSEISRMAASRAAGPAAYIDAVFYVVVLVWIIAIIDAYRIGRRNDSLPEE